MKVGILDFGMGNLGSIRAKVNRLGFEAEIVTSEKQIAECSKLILPGVGHFHQGIKNLLATPYFSELKTKVLTEKTPILGICLGMQLFTSYSEEGEVEGLGWVHGKTKKFSPELMGDLRVPHVGWNKLSWQKESPLNFEIDLDKRFYFTHSYYLSVNKRDEVVATANYGVTLDAIINKENIWGAQFHPEKSHQHGLKFIYNFLRAP